MIESKYIIYKTSMGSVPILFPAHLNHIDINTAMLSVHPLWQAQSAGFVKFETRTFDRDGVVGPNVTAYCSGKSSTMGLKVLDGDALIITQLFVDNY